MIDNAGVREKNERQKTIEFCVFSFTLDGIITLFSLVQTTVIVIFISQTNFVCFIN